MRSFWFVAGAGVGVYVVVKARRAAEVFTPEGLHDRLEGIAAGWQVFTDEVRTGMTEREQELRDKLAALPAGGKAERALPPGASRPGPLAATPDSATS